MAQTWLLCDDVVEHDTRPIAIADISRMYDELEDESLPIDDQMALAAVEAFPSIVATGSPFSVVGVPSGPD